MSQDGRLGEEQRLNHEQYCIYLKRNKETGRKELESRICFIIKEDNEDENGQITYCK